jgi:uncharacterized protein (TIGR03663 family)
MPTDSSEDFASSNPTVLMRLKSGLFSVVQFCVAASDSPDPKPNGRTNGRAHQSRILLVVGAASGLATAVVLRVSYLTLKPLHHDEGVNGFFLLGLFREGIYRYNAANYHGPTLYYFALITSSINNLLFKAEGPSTWSIRIVPVLFGLGIVGLAFAFRHRLGLVGTFFAAGLLAFSPGMVFLSRDFIHETLLGFFTLWLVVCGMRFYETGRSRTLLLGSIAAALMFATKETAPISLGAITVAAILATVLVPAPMRVAASKFGGGRRIALLVFVSILLFLACTFLFFSSFMSDTTEGIQAAVKTYSYWFRTGMTQQKAPWNTYLMWLLREESVILTSATIGFALALFQRRDRFAIFGGFWGFILLCGYSALPYKTPWILLNIIVPMALVGGWAAQQLWNYSLKVNGGLWPRLAACLLVLTMIFVLFQSVQLNFYRYDDSQCVYPYVQTRRGFLGLIAQVDRLAANNGRGKQISLAILTPDYWPLPWYLRDYRNAGYLGRVEPTNSTIVIASLRQQSEVVHALGERYRFVGVYPSRPGVAFLLYVANDQAR